MNSNNKTSFLIHGPWFYQTGVFDGKFVRVIGEGAEGIVISGESFGKKAAYKFVEIGAQKFHENMKKILKTLDENCRKLYRFNQSSARKLFRFMDTTGKLNHSKQNLVTRQQLYVEDDEKLAGFLQFQAVEVKILVVRQQW